MGIQHGSHENPGVPSACRQSRSACRKIVSRTGRVISVSSFWRKAHLHRKGHRDRPAGEDRHCTASRHVWDKQDSQRLQGGNNISKARRFFNEGGNQPLLLNNDPESQTPQLNRKGQNRPRDSSNFESGQSRNRSCSAHGIETCETGSRKPKDYLHFLPVVLTCDNGTTRVESMLDTL